MKLIVIHPDFPKLYSGVLTCSIDNGTIRVGSDVVVCFASTINRLKLVARTTGRSVDEVIASGDEWRCWIMTDTGCDQVLMSSAADFVQLTGNSWSDVNVPEYIQKKRSSAFARGMGKN